MQKFTATKVGPEGPASPASAPATRTAPQRRLGPEDALTESRRRAAREQAAHRPPSGEAAIAAGTRLVTASAASVSGRLATMQVQATGARSPEGRLAEHGADAVERPGPHERRALGRRQGQQDERGDEKVATSISSAVRTPERERDRRAAEDAGDLGDLVDGPAEGEHRTAQLRGHRFTQQRRLDAEEGGAAGAEQRRGQQCHGEVREQSGRSHDRRLPRQRPA